MTVLRDVIGREGTRAAFKGLAPSLLGIIPQWGIYFPTYNFVKDRVGQHVHNQTAASICAAVTAGTAASIVTNPVWVIKTRMQALSREAYPTMRLAARSIMEKETCVGFFRGLSASLMGVSHIGIQFPLYEGLKQVDLTQSPAVNIALASTMSKVVASAVTYPHEVLRTRIQCQTPTSLVQYRGLVDAFKKITAAEGSAALYRGMWTNMVRSVPASVITLVSYEVICEHITDFLD